MKFRNFEKENIAYKVEQQREAARKVRDTIKDADLSECEAGFELAKEMLIKNEEAGVSVILEYLFNEYGSGALRWLQISITFLLGMCATIITDNSRGEVNDVLIGNVIALLLFGWLIDVAGKVFENSNVKLNIRILRSMSFERYKMLIDSDTKEEEKKYLII